MDLDLSLIFVHWPFIAAFGLFYTVGRIMKNGPLSSERALEVPWVRSVRRWFPLPLHPIMFGVLLGLVPGVPVSLDADKARFGASLYFGAAGVLSIVWHDLYREWSRHKGEAPPPDDKSGLSASDTESVPPEDEKKP